jgi:hypothetical protein
MSVRGPDGVGRSAATAVVGDVLEVFAVGFDRVDLAVGLGAEVGLEHELVAAGRPVRIAGALPQGVSCLKPLPSRRTVNSADVPGSVR